MTNVSRKILFFALLFSLILSLLNPGFITAASPNKPPGGSKASFSMNFNTLEFAGAVQQKGLVPVYKYNNKLVSAGTYTISANSNYTLIVSGQDLSAGNRNPIILTVQRLSLSIDNQPPLTLSNNPVIIDSASTGPVSITRTVSFTLDLTDANNPYPDNAVLTNLSADTDFTSTITFSFTGL